MRTLVLGVGNLLLGDEGVGVHAAHALARRDDLGPDTHVVDAGTAFLDFLPEIEKAERILIVDAMEAGGTPGSVYRTPFDSCKHPQMLVSLHGFDLSRVLFMAGNHGNPSVTVFGVEPGEISWGMELSAAVAGTLPLLEQAIVDAISEGQGAT
jgi:hydrogenase maturation protease